MKRNYSGTPVKNQCYQVFLVDKLHFSQSNLIKLASKTYEKMYLLAPT